MTAVSVSVHRLSEVAEINPGFSSVGVTDDERVAFVPMAAVSEDQPTVVPTETRPIGNVRAGFTYFQNDDILVAKITPCFENGKIARVQTLHRHAFGSTEFHVVRPFQQVSDARYLLHFLRQDWIRTEGKRRMTGSAGQRRVPRNFIEDLEIPLPPLDEQRRIAAILDHADALRAKRRQALDRLDALTQSIFLDMFGERTTEGTCWPLRHVSEFVAGFQAGKSVEAESETTSETRNRVLKVSAVTSGVYRPEESKPVPNDYEPPAEHFVRPGDLLFSRANTSQLVGAVAFVKRTPSNVLLSDKLWRFLWAEPREAEPLFMSVLFRTTAVRNEIARRATGTSGSMKNISQEKFLEIRTIFPPLEMQRAFSRRLGALEMLKSSQERSLTAMESLFAALQQRAFQREV